jgi:hypothetical protein
MNSLFGNDATEGGLTRLTQPTARYVFARHPAAFDAPIQLTRDNLRSGSHVPHMTGSCAPSWSNAFR